MLARLSIRNIVLIEALDLAFAPGFTALTGETGAGKSILLDALSLVLGAKADGGLVRRGEREGSVTATFEVPPTHPAFALVDEMGLPRDDAILIRRTLTATGCGRGYVNDAPVSVRLLRQLGALLVEVHGQHADRGLMAEATHRRLVDAFGGLSLEAARTGEAWRALKAAETALAEHETALAAQREEAEFLRAAVDELTTLDPEPGEEERLTEGRQTMAAAEKVAGDLNEAAGALEGSRSPIPSLAGAL
ncbi:MAG: AAA family ATPase, partial [Pseudomonadota bacterium]